MFEALINLYSTNIIRAIIATIGLITILCLTIWISINDIKTQRIKFWKLFVTGCAIIIFPILTGIFCGCWRMPVYLLLAFPIWFLLLVLNTKFNTNRFVGKADIDILSAVFALMIAYSLWMFRTIDSQIAGAQTTYFWYSSFIYLLFGSIAFVLTMVVVFIIKSKVKKEGKMRKLIKDTKVSVLPMLIPFCLVVPYIIMTK